MQRRRTSSFLFGLTAALFCIVSLPFPLTGFVTAEAGQSRQTVDPERLAGQWVRPDGGYVLELKDVRKDGSIKAAYFNQRPIHVSRAELRRAKGGVSIFVELRDVNYPGSNYRLRYDPASDRLKGTYFQAVARETYDVEFIRLQ
jgi:hypothetical protein